mgnify:CR=1 FL=1
MTTIELITQIMEIVVIPLLGILTTYIVKLVNAKINEISSTKDNELEQKYLNMLDETITKCVIATTQTYVESLKKEGKFDKAAQEIAFNKTYTAVLAILSDEAKKYLTEAVGDLNLYITQQIEAEVKLTKSEM